MAGGYSTPPGDGLQPLIDQIKQIRVELGDLQRPSGTNLSALVAQVQQALANITTTVTTAIGLTSYTRSVIDAKDAVIDARIDTKVATPGVIAPTTVNASVAVNAPNGDFPVGVSSTGVYNELLTGGGGYKNQYIHVDGRMGYVPSSRQFKQDIESLFLNPDQVLWLRLVTFRYIGAVENLGDDAEHEVGLIAEEVHDQGLHWLVDYDEDGKPFGVKYERLALAFIPWAQSIETRLAILESKES